MLAALLRANRIPCGFAYQRLAVDAASEKFCLHGLNAVWLPDLGWHRCDPRGDRAGEISTSFNPPREVLAFEAAGRGEGVLGEVFSSPLPVVVSALSRYPETAELVDNLPDYTAQPPRNSGRP